MKKTRICIVDDEEKSIQLTTNIISKHFNDLEVVGTAKSVMESINMINETQPELVLLDIQLEDGLGFDVLNGVEKRNFYVIFITSYDSFAIKAFKYSAVDYLLKPYSIEELQIAIDSFQKLNHKTLLPEQLEILNHSIQNTHPQRIVVSNLEGSRVIELDELVYCETTNNNTVFYMKNNSHIITTKTLNTVEDTIAECGFFRIQHRCLVNMRHIVQYNKGKQGTITLENGKALEVSARRKNDFLIAFKEYAKFI